MTRQRGAIGRPVFATNSAGAKVWDATYLPFGGVHTTTGDPINLRFPGQWFQSEAGLHQNWMRDYDPTTGRYIQADPLGLIPGSSLYGYAYQNPMYWTDPTGECPWCIPVVVGAATSVALGWLLDDDGCYEWEEFLWDAGLGAAGGAAFKGAGAAWKWAKPTRVTPGLRSNPFKGKSAKDIDKYLRDRGFSAKGENPMADKGSYVNPKTGRSYHIDGTHPPPKGPHVGVTRPRGEVRGSRRGRLGRDLEM